MLLRRLRSAVSSAAVIGFAVPLNKSCDVALGALDHLARGVAFAVHFADEIADRVLIILDER